MGYNNLTFHLRSKCNNNDISICLSCTSCLRLNTVVDLVAHSCSALRIKIQMLFHSVHVYAYFLKPYDYERKAVPHLIIKDITLMFDVWKYSMWALMVSLQNADTSTSEQKRPLACPHSELKMLILSVKIKIVLFSLLDSEFLNVKSLFLNFTVSSHHTNIYIKVLSADEHKN